MGGAAGEEVVESVVAGAVIEGERGEGMAVVGGAEEDAVGDGATGAEVEGVERR